MQAICLFRKRGICNMRQYKRGLFHKGAVLKFLLSIFNYKPFQKGDCGVHHGGEDAKHKYCAHYKVELEHLTAVNDEVTDACL